MHRNRYIVPVVLVALAVLIVGSGVLVYAVLKGPNGFFGGHAGSPTANLGQNTSGLTPVTNKGCGISGSVGRYTFSWLHVTNGVIQSDQNCTVILKGFNWSQTEFGNAIGGGLPTRISDESVAWFNQNFHMNVIRILLNAVWWNENYTVPTYGIHYRDWIGQVVALAKKYGDYIILTKGPQFHNFPCGGPKSGPCPAQNQGAINIAANPIYSAEETTGANTDQAVRMWRLVTQVYANDPAVLYGSWNEMHNITAAVWYQSQKTLIDTIRAQSARSLIFVGGPQYSNDFSILVRGKVSELPQSNLVYDFHVYNGFSGPYKGKNCVEPLNYFWDMWPSHADEQVNYLQGRMKRAIVVGEWGGCNDVAIYNNALTSYAQTHSMSMIYYDVVNVFDYVNNTRILNENGLKVQAAYGLF